MSSPWQLRPPFRSNSVYMRVIKRLLLRSPLFWSSLFCLLCSVFSAQSLLLRSLHLPIHFLLCAYDPKGCQFPSRWLTREVELLSGTSCLVLVYYVITYSGFLVKKTALEATCLEDDRGSLVILIVYEINALALVSGWVVFCYRFSVQIGWMSFKMLLSMYLFFTLIFF